ncbi:receptor-like protein kinase HSL1 [Cornus florida]|uniref:receptor-like protein kinase HSL1 n=1 Tax=Cornus florida TaxID=4283 RepID=UPI002899B7DA|nr:receptor-like protein kinase HSL1 [Cornus florida]
MAILLVFFLSLQPLTLSLNQEGIYLQRVKLGLSDPAGVLSDWNEHDDTTCNWTGVTCDNSVTCSVESVDLSNAGLAGPFPTFLCSLPSLSNLSLSSTTSSIRHSLSPLRSDLSRNQISGQIPANLCENGTLMELLLISNSFTGNIPASLGEFSTLIRVLLRTNGLFGEVPEGFWE